MVLGLGAAQVLAHDWLARADPPPSVNEIQDQLAAFVAGQVGRAQRHSQPERRPRARRPRAARARARAWRSAAHGVPCVCLHSGPAVCSARVACMQAGRRFTAAVPTIPAGSLGGSGRPAA